MIIWKYWEFLFQVKCKLYTNTENKKKYSVIFLINAQNLDIL